MLRNTDESRWTAGVSRSRREADTVGTNNMGGGIRGGFLYDGDKFVNVIPPGNRSPFATGVNRRANIAPPVLDMTPVRLNMSLAKSLVDEVDIVRDRLGMTRSGFIAAVTRDYISRM